MGRQTIAFGLDDDVYAALETWRAANCPEASIAQAARELITGALAQHSGEGNLDAARRAEITRMQKWLHGRLQNFLSDIGEESRKISGP